MSNILPFIPVFFGKPVKVFLPVPVVVSKAHDRQFHQSVTMLYLTDTINHFLIYDTLTI